MGFLHVLVAASIAASAASHPLSPSEQYKKDLHDADFAVFGGKNVVKISDKELKIQREKEIAEEKRGHYTSGRGSECGSYEQRGQQLVYLGEGVYNLISTVDFDSVQSAHACHGELYIHVLKKVAGKFTSLGNPYSLTGGYGWGAAAEFTVHFRSGKPPILRADASYGNGGVYESWYERYVLLKRGPKLVSVKCYDSVDGGPDKPRDCPE